MSRNEKPESYRDQCLESAVFAQDSFKLDQIIAEGDLPEIIKPLASSAEIRARQENLRKFNQDIRELVESIYGKKDK